ncbi:sulfurtransferase TusA family protein [Zhaonella formicivorans]|uniref:sulfurtransferase TusA family protein n=1 Tax=Zhaonella formicivorans TaxID=2528593 RepID=UPI003BF5B11C
MLLLVSNIVDARGRSCPEPVVMTKNALDAFSGEVQVLVDTEVAKENVKRFAESQGYKVAINELEDEYKLIITK